MCLSAQGQILSPQTRKWRLIFMSLNTLSFIIWNTLQSGGGWELQSKERNPDRRVKTGLRPHSHQLGLRSRYLGGGLSIRFFSTSRFNWVLQQQQISQHTFDYLSSASIQLEGSFWITRENMCCEIWETERIYRLLLLPPVANVCVYCLLRFQQRSQTIG